jgi:hypothetical protein
LSERRRRKKETGRQSALKKILSERTSQHFGLNPSSNADARIMDTVASFFCPAILAKENARVKRQPSAHVCAFAGVILIER